jgi:chromosome segregation ATPase
MNDQIKERNSNGIYLIIILLLLACLAVFAYLYSVKRKEFNNCSNENILLKSDMQGMNDMMQGYVGNMSNDLKKDFKNMLATYDQLIEKDKSKADSLNMQKAQIQSLIDKLNSNKRLTASELYKLRKENETLRGIMRSYVKQIDSLNTLNIKLTSDLDQTSTKLNETTSERDQFRKESEEKGEKIKQGSRLQAYGFTSEALRMKLNKTTEQTDKAKNVIQFRSSFTISENSLTNAGRKSVYMQIIGPDGQTFQSSASNKIETDNGTIAYSDKKEIDYANQAVDLTIYYDLKSETALKGNYKVKIYCDGNLIGSDNFTLK